MLLASQNQAFCSAHEVIMKQCQKINSLEIQVKDVTRSMEFTQNEVEDLKTQINHHKREKIKNKKFEKLVQDDATGKRTTSIISACNLSFLTKNMEARLGSRSLFESQKSWRTSSSFRTSTLNQGGSKCRPSDSPHYHTLCQILPQGSSYEDIFQVQRSRN